MDSSQYDIVTVGGGLCGAALARVMAARGARVLVLERTKEFTDRVRGEVLVPWGTAEADSLGLLDVLREGCAHELRWWDLDIGGTRVIHRDIVATSEQRMPVLTFFHPAMQSLLVGSAVQAGAEVCRGAVVTAVAAGSPARVSYRWRGEVREARARLVVAADGRGSMVRKWCDFQVRRDRHRRYFAGVLMDDLGAPEDTMHSRFEPSAGLMSWIFPQGAGRARTYIGFHADSDFARLSGEADVERFIETSVRLGVPRAYYSKARVAGPLVTFDATDNWVDHPYRDGVALVGDAAATSDPTWGQGMSLGLRDVRVLCEQLASAQDWDSAGNAFAAEHDRGYGACHLADEWYTDLLLEIGPQADAARARALPLLAADPMRAPDQPISGPTTMPDAAARRRFFGEDTPT